MNFFVNEIKLDQDFTKLLTERRKGKLLLLFLLSVLYIYSQATVC